VLHDGFIHLFTKIAGYKGLGSFEGWMRKLFVNIALERLRKKDVLKGCNDYTAVAAATDDGVFEKLCADELMEKIRGLPTGFRTVFNLYAVEGYSHHDIARLLRISEGASRSQYARARACLQQMVKGEV
jgi:RNA polymerase sigma-70 factor (ECF subfamily)